MLIFRLEASIITEKMHWIVGTGRRLTSHHFSKSKSKSNAGCLIQLS